MGRRYFDVTIKGWKKQKNNKCVPFIRKLKEVCMCEKTKNSEQCLNGKRIFTTIWYNIKSKPICGPMIKKRSITIPCYNNGRANKWTLTKVETCRQPGQFTVKYFERFDFNSKTCVCKKIFKSTKTEICCKPCQFKTVCRQNNFEHISICEKPRNFKCFQSLSKIIKFVTCPMPVKEVVGNCDGKIIKYRITTFKNINCKCVKTVAYHNEIKPADRKECIKNIWKITRIQYKLINGVCQREIPRVISESVECTLSIRFVDKNINECSFKRLFIGKKVKDCKCVDHVIRTEILYYKCCQKNIVKSSCMKNRIKVVSTTSYLLMDFKCYPVTKISKDTIKCHLKSEEKISTGLCTYEILRYSVFSRNCKCYRKLINVLKKENCCTHRKSFTKSLCDSVKGFKIIIHSSFHHKKDDTCIKLVKKTSIPINCDILGCNKIESQCYRKTKTVQVFCFKRKGCQCFKEKSNELKTCCGKRFSWIKKDSCGQNRKDFIRTRYYALKFNPQTKLCLAVVIKEIFNRCRCSNPTSSMRCVKDNSFIITRISYILKKSLCNLVTSEKIVPVRNCPKKSTIKIKELCNRETGWKTIEYRTMFPKNCKCLFKTFIKKEICICSIAFPNPKEKVFCKNDYIMIKEKRIAHCSKTKVQWSTFSDQIPILLCKKTKTEIGSCYSSKLGNAIKIRYDVVVQYFMKNCNCQRKELKRILKHCTCKPSHVSIKCVGNKKIQSVFSYVLFKGICQQRIYTSAIKVPCPVKPAISNSPCVKNKYTITKISFSLKNCQCEKLTERKSCDCKCSSDRKYRKCSGKYFINEITINYQKQKCICHRKQTVVQIVPVCPRFIAVSKGSCIFRKFGSYREIIKRQLEQNKLKCQCKVKELKSLRICGCPGKVFERKLCKNNNLITEIWGWKINTKKNNCEKYLRSSNQKPIICPSKKVQKKCLTNGKNVIERYHLKNCKCHKSVREYICKCKETPILIKQGRCSGRPKCSRVDYYRHEILRGEKCVNINTKRIVTCCCPKNQIFNKCEKNTLFNFNIKFNLQFNKCVKKEMKNLMKVTCSDRIIKIEGKCKKNGFKLKSYYKEILKNCKCIKEKIKSKICQCQCPKSKTQLICDIPKKSIKTIITKYVLTKCKCESRNIENSKILSCPRDLSVSSNCLQKKGTNYWIITTRTTKFSLNDKCQCVSKTITAIKVCRCESNKKIKTHCNVKTHETVIKTMFNILKNERCVRIVRTWIKPVKCNEKWKLKSDSGCKPHGFYGIKTLTYSKLIRDRCSCKEITKSVSCHCACSGPRIKILCINERIYHKSLQYKIKNCKCQHFIQSEKVIPVKCKKLPSKIGKCKIYKNRCIRIIKHKDPYTIKCKCFYRSRIEQQPCQSCSCSHFSNKICDQKSNNIIITTKECRILSNGWIKQNVKISTKETPCVHMSKCKQITKCNKKTLTQTFDCIIPYKYNCECKFRNERKIHLCECKPVQIQRSKCNKKTCLRNITRTKFHLVVSINDKKKCVKESRVHQEKCCCPMNPKDETKCIKNKLIKKIRKYQFDKVKKTCNSIKQNLDITPKCQPAVKYSPGKCNKSTCLVTNKILHKHISFCRCVTTKKIQIRECCCRKKSYKENKCLGRLFITNSHKFVFKNSKCSESQIRNSFVVNCKAARIERLKCNLSTGKRVIKHHSFIIENCKCLPKVVVKEILCKCPKSTVRRICLADKGIARIINKYYKLNEKLNKCDEIVKNEDQEIKCNKNQQSSCNPVRHRHNNGIYKKCTTKWNHRTGCICIEQLQWIYRLSNCDKDKTVKQCLKNTIVKRNVYFVRQKSSNKNYDYSCVRKEQILPAPQLICGKPYIKKSKCVNSFMTYTYHYNIRTMCQCISQMKIYRILCACREREEISRKCIDERKVRKTFRNYKLNCDNKLIPTCKCMHDDRSVDVPVKCPDDQFKAACIHGKGVKTWTTYDIKNCKCVADKRTKMNPDCKNTVCRDILSGSKCQMIKNYGKCNKMNIYSQFLCPITCGYCEKCQPTTIKKYLSQCRCKRIARKKICFRQVMISVSVPNGRKCPVKFKVVEIFCDCKNELSNEFCLKSMKQGHCSQIKTKQKCAYHCNYHCQQCGRDRVYKKCVQEGKNKGTYEVLRIKFFKIKNHCLFTRKIFYEGHCKICNTKPYKTVLSCFNGKRYVVTKFMKKLPNGICKIQENKEVYSCKDCCKDVITKISSCSNNSRVITIIFWSNVKGYCKKHKVSNVYNCNKKCSNVKLIKTNCVYNKQLVVKTWYSDSVCIPHVLYEVVRC